MAIDSRNCFWFGTEERMGWFATPLQGADSSPSAWGADGTLLNGGGWALNSWGSHKRYSYEWPASSSREVAQKMKSYRDGTFGRGLLYFLEPSIYTTNVLPAHWADPSMAIDNEAPSLVYGVHPIAVQTSGGASLGLPITSAQYDLSSVGAQTAPTPDSSVFIPIPTGHTLFLGAFYSATGTGGVFATPVNGNGTLGTAVKLTAMANSSPDVVIDSFSGDLRGVRLWVGHTEEGSSTVTLAAMAGRLIETSSIPAYTPWVEQARNLFSNPGFEAGPGEVRVPRGGVIADDDPDFVVSGLDMVGVPVAGIRANQCIVVRSSKFGGSMRIIPTSATDSNSYAEIDPRLSAPTAAERTGLVTRHLEAPLTGALNTWALSLRSLLPDGASFSPNEAGSVELRRNYTWDAGSSSGRLLFFHGGLVGSGDSYWTMGGIFPGTYTGPWFSGSSNPAGDLERTRWLGETNASESVFETRTGSGDPARENRLKRGPWIGGQGHSGCRFLGTPTYITNSPIEGGRIGFSASFAEVGSWIYG